MGKHWKSPLLDTEIWMLWTPGFELCSFTSEEQARSHFEEDWRSKYRPRMFRFNPASPEETRDITQDFIPEDEAEPDDIPNTDRSHLVSSVGDWQHSAGRNGR
jgi:hypothetical protein